MQNGPQHPNHLVKTLKPFPKLRMEKALHNLLIFTKQSFMTRI